MNINEIQPIRKGRTGNLDTSAAMSADEYVKAEIAIIQYTLQIADKHFAQAKREFNINREPTATWFLFGLHLQSALIPHTDVLNDADCLAFLRSLFADIFDFLMFAYEGDPAQEMADLYRAFGSGIRCGPILPLLLPNRAQPVIGEMNRILQAEYEDEMRCQDQMGY